VADIQFLVPEQPSDLLDDILAGGLFHPTRPWAKLDDELTVERGGQLAERRDFEA
jgi:hypothetical protein